jgi:hydrogenase expression/formation protein HypE
MDKKLEFGSCPVPIGKHDTVQLGHGSGGRMMNDLIREMFLDRFNNQALSRREDHAVVQLGGNRIAFSTDSFVVDPLFFPGGDIGDLAVNGTVNDVAMSGASPLFLSAGFIIEEGFSMEDLRRVTDSMVRSAEAAGVQIVTGDTKVVNKGQADKLFINTAGIGGLERPYMLGADRIRTGDRILINGTVADHGVAILSCREGLAFETTVESDSAPLNGLIDTILNTVGDQVHALRDPTRGGVASALNEFAETSGVGIRLDEARIPIAEPVRGACELLGLDPLHVANEGKLLAVVDPAAADEALQAMRSHPYGGEAAMIGDVVAEDPGRVTLRTRLGTWRIVDMLVGEQLPRIC